ncbi:STN and carboxypeptidase regulatory-like domain-containing protein [Pedobacter ginsenosidimutans]|uniref:STN and carboxypeptidase regulatory-like domain-containing protein n=1 Tax=Pedobacter ginsenosidimutans TaxID=687842 RepID=UPI000A61ED29|nr:STN and carboxypeptidase regulatory-like domain-containing protein [Pedobacter ginsenosidimutans]
MRTLKITVLFLFIFCCLVRAQSNLSRNISLNIERQKLSAVLAMIEEKGGFRFSYNSNILPVDSLISIRENNLNIAETLDKILNHRFEYRQSGNFVIIRYAPLELVLLVNESVGDPELYTITGQVVDKQTNKPIQDASIYERNLLVSEISDGNGYFSMRLKNITQPISLTVSKENYKSTVTHFLAEVNITNRKENSGERFIGGNLGDVENTWLGNALVTAQQKIQSINIGGFISKAPFQFSLIPGLNSHGSLSGQVVNKFSLNVIGAYSAGVDGGEIGFIFNINKSNVQYFQFAGAFNLVGGNVRGVQIAGFFNDVIGDVRAAEVALAYNRVGKSFEGFQVGGIYNHVNQDVKGIQLSLGLNTIGGTLKGWQTGALNLVNKETKGVQIGVGGNIVAGRTSGIQIGGIANINKESSGINLAVLTNFTGQTASGLQIGAINYAKNLKGAQVGILNVSNENDGYSIGLINIALKGYHKFSFSTNESTNFNIAYKGGSKRLYNMLMFGTNKKSAEKIYTGGLGFGKEMKLFKSVSLNPEISSQYVYQGSWDYLNLLNKFELPINIRINKWLAIQGGPSVNVYYTKQNTKIGEFGLLQEKHKDFSFNNSRYTGWLGWNVGLVVL